MIAEHCTIPLQGHASVELYELSDYATLRSDRGNGLFMTAMQLEAIRRIRGNQKTVKKQ